MKRFDYHSVKWNDYILKQIGKTITAAKKENKLQQLYVYRIEDAEQIMDMLEILSTVSRYACLIEVRYVSLN